MRGYCGNTRGSTFEQDTAIQKTALMEAGASLLWSENILETKRQRRGELEALLELNRESDTLLVARIDRLARSIKDLQDIVYPLMKKEHI